MAELPAGIDPWFFESFSVFGYPECFQIESSIPGVDLLRFSTNVAVGAEERVQRQLIVPRKGQGIFHAFPSYPEAVLAEYPALENFTFELGGRNERKSVEVFGDLDDYPAILSNYLASKPFWRAVYQFEERTY